MRYAAPCLDCEYRHPKCHSKCTAYIDFVESNKAAKAEVARIKVGDSSYLAYQSSLASAIRRRADPRNMAKQIGQR